MSGFLRLSDENFKELLQVVRGLPADSPALKAACDAIYTNNRWEALIWADDKSTYKLSALKDEMRYSVQKTKLQAYLTAHPNLGIDATDRRQVNNLLQLLNDPAHFDQVKQADAAPAGLKKVTAAPSRPSRDEDFRDTIKMLRELAGDPQDWLKPDEIDALLREIDRDCAR